MKLQEDNKRKGLRGSAMNFIIGMIIALVLLIPTGMINDLIYERKSNQNQVAMEISRDWGGEQLLIGPFLEVPFNYIEKTGKDNEEVEIKTANAIFLPKKVNISGDLKTQIKKRSIYKFIVYKSDLNIKGSFSDFEFSKLQINNKELNDTNLLWDKAKFRFFISDLKGLSSPASLKWIDTENDFEPMINENFVRLPSSSDFSDGIYTDVNVDILKNNEFSFNLKLKGSTKMSFVPTGEYSIVNITSDWHSPKFSGNYSPDKSKVADTGFSGSWNVNELNRPLPQQWIKNGAESYDKYSFGVELIQPVDKYLKSIRATKYAILFIMLSIIAMFMIEVFTKRENNLLQYLLVGLALVLFYSILLSLTELMSFNLAYLISAISIISLISLYSYWVMKSAKSSLILFLLWTILYGFLFYILQLEEHALLAGNIGLFVILTVIMFVSRKFSIGLSGKKTQKEYVFDKGDKL